MNFLKKGFQQLQTNTQNLINQIQEKRINNKEIITEISSQIYWMRFPDNKLKFQQAKFLNDNHSNLYQIWNVSEISYDASLFNEQVSHNCCQGYSTIPLFQILMICKGILCWLSENKQNIAIIHCQNDPGRSALVISSLLYIMKIFNHPAEALTHFCQIINQDENKIMFPTQKIYLNFISNIIGQIKLNTKRIVIKKIIMSDVPQQLINNRQIPFVPYLQLFEGNKIKFNSLKPNVPLQGYDQNDLSIFFEVNTDVQDDFLIRVKNFNSNEVRFPVFRCMMHSAFVFDNVVRFYKKDIDVFEGIKLEDQFFIDMIIEHRNEDCEQNQFQYLLSESLKYLWKINNNKNFIQDQLNENNDKFTIETDDSDSTFKYTMSEESHKSDNDSENSIEINDFQLNKCQSSGIEHNLEQEVDQKQTFQQNDNSETNQIDGQSIKKNQIQKIIKIDEQEIQQKQEQNENSQSNDQLLLENQLQDIIQQNNYKNSEDNTLNQDDYDQYIDL